MMHFLLPFFFLVQAWPKGEGATDDPAMPFMEYLDSDHLVRLKWGFNDQNGTITFTLIIKTTGWMGFGLSPNGGMQGSDIVIGGFGPSGSYFTDRHATGNTLPLLDNKQSYTLLSMSEVEGQTSMTFQRPIHTCDDQDFDITGDPIKLIYAYGQTDEISYHGDRRGIKEVNLLRYMPRAALPSLTYLSVTMDNISIPPIHTHYHCRVMKLLKLNKKHHIFRIEPVIEHPGFVHHMVLYSCPKFVNEPYDNQCNEGDKGDHCINMVAVWGIGAAAFELPENAGIPVGGENVDQFYKLEIHYDNPTSETGKRDSSGLRMYYTDQLRQHDVGILDVGVMLTYQSLSYTIPPKAAQFHTYAVCNTTLFAELHADPVPDLQAFAMVLHTHLAGRKIRADLFRPCTREDCAGSGEGHKRGLCLVSSPRPCTSKDGEHIDAFGLDENYNFEIQQFVNFGNIKTIKPGDDIVVECIYNTVNRTGLTKMWFSTTDEMCYAFIFYYPAIDINTCLSIPNVEFLPMNPITISSEKNYTADEIAKYEALLKSAPQIQIVSNVNNQYSKYESGTVRDWMKTPPVSCRNSMLNLSPTPSAWRAGATLLLLWIAVM